jgi:hypothetical protein
MIDRTANHQKPTVLYRQIRLHFGARRVGQQNFQVMNIRRRFLRGVLGWQPVMTYKYDGKCGDN